MWVDLDFFFSAQQELLHDDYRPTHKETEKKKKLLSQLVTSFRLTLITFLQIILQIHKLQSNVAYTSLEVSIFSSI